jgi:hypothetical protein
MKILVLSVAFTILASMQLNAQSEEATLQPFSIGDVEFSVTPKQIDKTFKVQFLFPRAQHLEMYMTDLNGDNIASLLENQLLTEGVKTYTFDFPEDIAHGSYLLIIKSNGKSVIKKLDYLPKT